MVSVTFPTVFSPRLALALSVSGLFCTFVPTFYGFGVPNCIDITFPRRICGISIRVSGLHLPHISGVPIPSGGCLKLNTLVGSRPVEGLGSPPAIMDLLIHPQLQTNMVQNLIRRHFCLQAIDKNGVLPIRILGVPYRGLVKLGEAFQVRETCALHSMALIIFLNPDKVDIVGLEPGPYLRGLECLECAD